MNAKARVLLAAAGATALGLAGAVGVTSGNAGAEPVLPIPPAPATVTQTVTVAAAAAPPVAPVAPVDPVAPPAPVAPAAPVAPVAPMATAPQMATNTLGPVGQGSLPAGQTSPAPPAVPQPTLRAASSGTLKDYFNAKGVTLEPQHAQDFRALNITLPMPRGWAEVPDPNVVDAFVVIANRNSPDLYTPNAQVVVYKLIGDFDPKEAITHGFIDSQMLPAWQTTDATLADFYGQPSSLIEGAYRQNGMTLNTSRRHVITTFGPDKYLVSLSVTSSASRQAAPTAADATDAIVNGFRVMPGAA